MRLDHIRDLFEVFHGLFVWIDFRSMDAVPELDNLEEAAVAD